MDTPSFFYSYMVILSHYQLFIMRFYNITKVLHTGIAHFYSIAIKYFMKAVRSNILNIYIYIIYIYIYIYNIYICICIYIRALHLSLLSIKSFNQ